MFLGQIADNLRSRRGSRSKRLLSDSVRSNSFTPPGTAVAKSCSSTNKGLAHSVARIRSSGRVSPTNPCSPRKVRCRRPRSTHSDWSRDCACSNANAPSHSVEPISKLADRGAIPGWLIQISIFSSTCAHS